MLVALTLLLASPDDCSSESGHFLARPYPLSGDSIADVAPESPPEPPAFALQADEPMPPKLRDAIRLRDAAQYPEALRGLQAFAKTSPDSALGVAAAHDASLLLAALGYGDTETAVTRSSSLIEAWDGTCPWETSTGGCFEWVGPPRKLRPGLRFVCGPRPTPPRLLPRRSPREIQRRAGSVLRAYERDPASTSRDEAAEAAFILAEVELEALLELRAPRGLEFTVEEWRRDSGVPEWESLVRAQKKEKERSECAFRRHYERLIEAEHRTEDAFQRVLELRVPRWSVAAASRIGGLYETFEVRLSGEVVGGLERVTDAWDMSWCHPGLYDHFQVQAIDMYEACIQVADAHLVHGPYVAACEQGLVRLSDFTPNHDVLDPAGQLGLTTGSATSRVHAVGPIEG